MIKPVAKTKIGFLLTGDYVWIGGLYYVLNILKALSKQSSQNIEFVALTNKSTPHDIITELEKWGIPFVFIDEFSLINKLLFNFQKRIKRLFAKHKITSIYPLLRPDGNFLNSGVKPIFWIPDFQHKFYPDFFSESELHRRDNVYGQIAQLPFTLILSSENATKHFKRFYPDHICNTEILRFKSIISPNDLSKLESVSAKYPISEPYFIVCNQFWKHKNHLLVIEAAKILKRDGIKFNILMTGKEDNQFPEVYQKIRNEIELNQLESVHLIGFITRADQLRLMRNSLAVIQPSKFEGWSTVIEDAKSLSTDVIAANIEVNQEQLGDSAIYFDAENASELASALAYKMEHSKRTRNEKINVSFKNYTEELVSLFTKLTQ